VDVEGVIARRLGGYRAALSAAGIDLRDDALIVGPASIEGGFGAIRHAWEAGLRPTAVLAMSDAMAIGAMRALRELGLDVPSAVSVVGFDDIDLSVNTNPPLTTVHQPIRRKGEEAVRLLLTIVERREPTRPEHHRLETHLVVRASTGPAPQRRQEVIENH
jgi:DNA-binding LacI/PurR family transcriptional regulator